MQVFVHKFIRPRNRARFTGSTRCGDHAFHLTDQIHQFERLGQDIEPPVRSGQLPAMRTSQNRYEHNPQIRRLRQHKARKINTIHARHLHIRHQNVVATKLRTRCGGFPIWQRIDKMPRPAQRIFKKKCAWPHRLPRSEFWSLFQFFRFSSKPLVYIVRANRPPVMITQIPS